MKEISVYFLVFHRKITKYGGSEGQVHWFTLSGRCTCPKMLNVKINLFAFAETQLSRGALPHRQSVKGHGEAQVQQRIGGSMFLAVCPGGSRDCEPSARLVQLLQSVKNRVRGD